MKTCFDCKHRNIMTNPDRYHNDLECHCKLDGRWRNPYRPMVFFDLECPYWGRKEDDDEETV